MPPEATAVTEPPLQILAKLTEIATGAGLTISTDAVPVRPKASVAATEYEPAAMPDNVLPPTLLLQR